MEGARSASARSSAMLALSYLGAAAAAFVAAMAALRGTPSDLTYSRS